MVDLKNYEAIIFDLDGTILNSSDEIMLCLGEAFERENLKIDKSKLNHNIIGPALNKMVRLVLPELSEDYAQKVVDNYNKIYDSEKYACSELYGGMLELLVELKNSNKRLFMATNKFDFSTHRLIKKFKLSFFEDVYTIDKYKGKILSKKDMIREIIEKYNLERAKTIMIGDALGDVLAAKENGIASIGALWGYGDNKQPIIDNATYAIENVNYLNKRLEMKLK